MAKMKMFCVHDSKVGAYLQPFFLRSRGEALRAWGSAVNDPQTQFCKFPSDFTLFEIGEFCEDTGSCEMLKAKVALGVAVEFKNKPEGELPVLQAVEAAKKGV